ncbi:probable WRKY transcription factor 3 [Populus alba]|uniref:Putative WRKY transcription factor 3 isoform X2 n=1 Tax=Populus alba TaxID=43335 RepID=A0A4U5QCY3_POPAL|nr:putative WRKY transcription factor 3 isoform X2 [Populus alba]
MAEKQENPTTAAPAKPTITLPPRPSMETLFTGGLSPGPMTLVSSFFADTPYPESDYPSFSQLLAGAMASPIAKPAFFTDNLIPNNNNTNTNTNTTTTAIPSSKEDGINSNSNLGFKLSRPTNLVVARSPLFTVPPGLSPSGLLDSPAFFSPRSPFGMSHQQALAQVTFQAALFAQSQMHMQAQYQPSSVTAAKELLTQYPSFNPGEALQQQQLMPPSTSDAQNSLVEPAEFSHSERKYQPPAGGKPTDDGYNWRKYGQKPIKGSEYPRSYYKCRHLNCPVKKKVERSSDGQITEIIYKGQHNHDQLNKLSKDGDDSNGSIRSQSKPEGVSQAHVGNVNKLTETLPAHSVTRRDQESTQADPSEPPGSSDNEEADNAAVQEEERGDDEPIPKRRQIDVVTSEVTLPHKTITEPKIIVQTRSEVDLLDDGYRWRKYGQKVVKGNPHPRSYYKCTSAGCNVRNAC